MHVLFDLDQTKQAEPTPDPQGAWQPFDPGQAWNLRWAGHLLRRIGFGPTWPELQQALRLGPQKTLDRAFQPTPEVDAFHRQMNQWESSANELPAIRAWWLRRMLETPQPLLEKMTLFWHGQLALGNVRQAPGALVRDYLRSIRCHALGRWDELLRAVVLHPAMLLSHGAEANRKARPNEHFARVVLEHFTAGPGQFSEKDVHELARALTGWFVFREELRFIEREQDTEPKRLFGQSGPMSMEEAFELLARQPAAAKTLVRKLYRFFISEAGSAPEGLLEALAAPLTQGAPIGQVVERMLRSNWFFSSAAYRRRVKSPVEWALGVLRPLETLPPTEPLGHGVAEMGQSLAEPPTPAGWPDGTHWISPALLLARTRWTEQLTNPQSPFGQKFDPAAAATRHGSTSPTSQANFLVKLYLQDDLAAPTRTKLLEEAKTTAQPTPADHLRQLAQTLVLLPEFQLA